MVPNEIAGGPYLAAALFCEKVLKEADGVISLIRIVDRWTVVGPSEAMPATVIQTTLVLLMKSGIHRGSSQLTIAPFSPSGAALQEVKMSTHFEGDDDRGVGVIAPLAFPVQEPGVYWFDIKIDGQTLTKVPLRVLHQFVAGMQPPNPMEQRPPRRRSGTGPAVELTAPRW